jgi:hypothetical protein
MAKVSIDEARRIKPKAGEVARRAASVAGVGLTKVGDSYAVKVNLADQPAASAQLPKTIDGVSVVYEVVGRIAKRL